MKLEKVAVVNGVAHDVEIDIDTEDVIDFISIAGRYDTQRIHDECIDQGADPADCDHEIPDLSDIETYNSCAESQGYPKIESLHDQMKMEFITSIWNDFTLEQMEKKLKKKSNIKWTY